MKQKGALAKGKKVCRVPCLLLVSFCLTEFYGLAKYLDFREYGRRVFLYLIYLFAYLFTYLFVCLF